MPLVAALNDKDILVLGGKEGIYKTDGFILDTKDHSVAMISPQDDRGEVPGFVAW